MSTTIRPNQRPGKLSSKFGAAFAAFENNSGESNVPQAFRSAVRRKTTKPTGGSNSTTKQEESNKENPKTRIIQSDTKSINSDDLSGSTGKPEQPTESPAAPNGGDETQLPPKSTPAPLNRNFRVPSKLANRANMFEASNNNGKGLRTTKTTAYKNARQGLRKVKQSSAETPAPAAAESLSEPSPSAKMELFLKNVAATKKAVGIIDDELVEVDEEDIQSVEKDTADIGSVCTDDEYDEVWEEETLDSTEEEEEEEDGWSCWEEETIEDGPSFLEEEEYSVGAQSSS